MRAPDVHLKGRRVVIRPLTRKDLREMSRWPRFQDPLYRLFDWPKRSKTSLDNLLKAHAETPVPEDDDEELLFVETPTDDEDIFMVKRSTGTVVESRLTPEEKELFAEAKKQACMVSSRTRLGFL